MTEVLHTHGPDSYAVIGIACRVPGADNYQQFWSVLESKTTTISEIPPGRWDVDGYFSADADAPNRGISKWGGFIRDYDKFDAAFWGVSPREARSMDPQQRVLLELAWECCEDGGYAPGSLAGQPVGAFVAVCNFDYKELGAVTPEIEGHLATGTYASIISNRISYLMDLRGPSLSIDTACSGSLVAVHSAIDSMRRGECEMALVGGVTLMCTPTSYVSYSKLGMLSPTGECRSFDASADGFVRAEGAVLVLLKPLARALADGDPIRAIIRGSAVNHGGRERTLTTPSVDGQARVVADAYTRAGIPPQTVSYLETHGTGTMRGDPIEMQGLLNAFRELHRRFDTPAPAAPYCGIGTAKSNVGHLEGTAGIAGLVKVVLALQHRCLPGLVHFKQLNPRITLKGSPFYIVENTQEWPETKAADGTTLPRRAGVSSFGFGGVNAHVVLEEAPVIDLPASKSTRPIHLYTLSARSDAALRALAQRHADYLDTHPNVRLEDACYTLNVARTPMERRLAAVAPTRETLVKLLQSAAAGNDVAGLVAGATDETQPKVAFLFTGQGSQYVGMGRELYATQPVFREAIDRCDAILRAHLDRPLLDLLYPANGAGSHLDETAYTQPALFAVEYALAMLWQSLGVKPGAVLGHSVGEYVAACIAGVFSLEDGLKLIAARGRLMQALPRNGAMAVCATDAARVEEIIQPFSHDVAIAALNGPRNVVFSGRTAAVEQITAKLREAGVQVTPLSVSHAFHSPLMEPMLDEFERIASTVTFHPPKLAVISNLTGKVAGAELLTPQYWRAHVRQPVRFASGISALRAEGYDVLIETGPAPVLIGMAKAIIAEESTVWCPSLRNGQSDWRTLLESVGRVFVRGVPVNSTAVAEEGARRIPLPTYAFQRERFWFDSGSAPRELVFSELLSESGVERVVSRLLASGRFSGAQAELLPDVLRAMRSLDAPAAKAAASESNLIDLLYEPTWQEQGLGAGPLGSASDIPRIEASMREAATAFQPQADLTARLEQLSLGYIVDAFKKLGWSSQAGERFEAANLADSLRIASAHRSLFGRLLEILGEEGFLERNAAGWVVRKPLAHSGADIAAVRAASPGITYELDLLDRCGTHLSEVLTGQRDAVSLLFPEGDAAATRAFYRDSLTIAPPNRLAREAMKRIVSGLPLHRSLRVLEIGAGTGGTTAHLLPELDPRRTEYVFTDVGAFFLNQAKQEFHNAPYMQFRLLDIEKPPATQGWDTQQFDLIVAANVLHATADLRRTIRHARELLAPGGVLMLVECTAPRRWVDLTFGLTEGWWRFRDKALRPSYPLLTAQRWIEVLKSEGFEEAASAAPTGDMMLPQSVVVARAPAAGSAKAVGAGTWLIFEDAGGVGERLAGALRARGRNCLQVASGERYTVHAGGRFTLNCLEPAHLDRFFADTAANAPFAGIVYLQGLNARVSDATSTASLAELVRNTSGSALNLVQATLRAHPAQPPRLWLVTQSAAAAEGAVSLSSVAQAPLLGFGTGVSVEHAELRCARFDIDSGGEKDLAALVDELLADGSEDRIAVRSGRRFVSRLVRSQSTAAPDPLVPTAEVSAEGAYLITGGLGGLGVMFARWLVDSGARHVVLVGRGPPKKEAGPIIATMKRVGAAVTIRQLDISDEQAVSELVAEFGTKLPPLRGVIHSAGRLDDGILLEQRWDRFANVFAAKVSGTWNLHRATQKLPVDFFLLFSSVVAIFGNPGQANHAAANAFQDAFAHARRAAGLPALSINWGAWGELGAAAGKETLERLGRRGILPFKPSLGVEATACAMRGKAAQIAAVSMDWSAYWQASGGSPFVSAFKPATLAQTTQAAADFRGTLEAAPREGRDELLVAHVREQVARSIGVDDPLTISAERGFFALGLDSLTSVELRNRLQRSLRVALPSTVAFDYPTLDGLVGFLKRDMLPPELFAAPVASVPVVKETVPEVSTEDLSALVSDDAIARELAELQSVLSRND